MADTLVLCYHAVSTRWDADLSVTPEALEQQLTALQKMGYRGVTFTDAVQYPARGKQVAVTFDDAFASVATLARPILDRLNWPGTIFAVSDFAAGGLPLHWWGVSQWETTEHRDELASLSWDELRALADDGWEIGSHTVTHPKLTELDDATLAHELAASRTALEDALDRPCLSLAYPYGDVDPRVIEAAGAAGYVTAATLPAKWHDTGALEWPRVGVYHPDSYLRFRVKAARLGRKARGALNL